MTDKELRELMRDCREDRLLVGLAAEVLQLRKVKRAARAYVNAPTWVAQNDAMNDMCKALDKARGKAGKSGGVK